MIKHSHILLFFFLPAVLFAQKKILPATQKKQPLPVPLANTCYESTAQADLDVNNVRTRILNGADMWWDLANGMYEIPKGSGVNSIFAGSLWIGAIDQGGQLRMAGQTYRQTGNDFWPGPIDTVNVSTTDSVCAKYDRIWNLNRYQVEEFILRYKDTAYTIPKDILEWPGNGDVLKGQTRYLAPYIDNNADGKYNAYDGDYPAYDYTGTQNCQYNLLGDQTLWWVFNDVGNIHGETGGSPLGIEIQAQAFSYQAGNEVNDMTFYQYKVINRSTNTLDSMYWGQWIDADLGNYTDDYVACDVKRGLGYCYNGDADDEIPTGYGLHPPAIGCDFLGGPLADIGDGIDNDRDSVIDEAGERIMMAFFMNYDIINGPPIGNPSGAQWFYYYLKGLWGNGTPKTYGGNGYQSGGPTCSFMYPRDSDPYGWGTGGIPQAPWDEVSAGNIPQDRKFMMSAGEFTMQPGAVQFITEGLIWGRDTLGNNMDGMVAMQKADDKAQILFDNCFTPILCAPPNAQITHQINKFSAVFAYYGQGTSYFWDFGDGVTSTQKFPKHTYTADGKYTVCLTVTNACGTDSTCIFVNADDGLPPPWGFRLKRIEGYGNGGQVLDLLPESVDSMLTQTKSRVYHPRYEYLRGPVHVGVYDTTLLPNNKFIIKLDGITNGANWKMYRVGFTDTVFSDSTIGIGNLQKIPQWGMEVRVKQNTNPGILTDPKNGFLESSLWFTNTAKQWLTGLADKEGNSYENWIRSGTITSGIGDYLGIDPNEVYEGILGGTWAPYRLCGATELSAAFDPNKYYAGPGFKLNLMSQVQMKDLASVDVIITSDKSKWSRCVVFEMSEDSAFSKNTGGISKKARKLDFRRDPSVDKNGSTATGPDNNDFATGMGWFPGYAVNLETGERLNISFGENSALVNENGNDMIWNPTGTKYASTYNLPWDTTGQPFGSPVFGGQHYIYVFGHNRDNDQTPLTNTPNDTINVPRYDRGKRMREILSWDNNLPTDSKKRELYREAMWANIPLLSSGHNLLETDVKVRLRVSKQYAKYYSGAYFMDGLLGISNDSCFAPLNKNNPMYEFETSSFGLDVSGTIATTETLLFPNPFYTSAVLRFDNKRSDVCELAIFDLSGKAVRHYKNLTGQSVIIECGNLHEGIYFYSLTSRGSKKVAGKFVILGSK
ncbi:MAG: PKD domain-containing protein [Bacteroidetes bacterium]|nr:MAG: PKD domain-containing protein [Bacteroidota bacterium]